MTRWTKVLVLLSGAVLSAGCGEAETAVAESASAAPVALWELSTTSAEARRQVQAGMHLMDMNELFNNRPFSESANDHFKRAVTEDPSWAYAYLMAAVTAPSLEEYRANLRQAVELASTAGEAERLQIELEQRLFERDLEAAAEVAQRLIDATGSNPRAWVELARARSIAGQEEAAREAAARAVEVDPDFTRGHLWLANSYLLFEPQDWTRAETHVQRALALEPDEAAPHDLQGDVHRAHGRLEEAAAAYTRALELDPSDAPLLIQRGHVYTFAGEYDKARADYDASSERSRGNTRATALFYRALVSTYAGDPEATVAELLELEGRLDRLGLTDVDGVRLQLLNYLAGTAIGSGQFEEGRAAVERLAILGRARAEMVGTDEFRRAREADIASWEGMLAALEGDYATALARAERVRTLLTADRDPSKDRPVHALLGLVALGQERYAEAVGHLEQADPNDEYLRFKRALALEGAGRTDEAREIYRALATNNFNTGGLALVRRDAVARAGM